MTITDPDEAITSMLADVLEDATALWAVHVQGPDDILAAESGIAAVKLAAEINATAEWLSSRPDASPDDPWMHAEVVRWGGTAEAHAASLAKLESDGGYMA